VAPLYTAAVAPFYSAVDTDPPKKVELGPFGAACMTVDRESRATVGEPNTIQSVQVVPLNIHFSSAAHKN